MISTDQALSEFLLSRQANGVSANTVRWYKSLLSGLPARFPRLAISTHDLREYIVELRGRLSPASVNGHITALHVFYGWVASEYDTPNPMKGIKRPKMRPAQPKGIYQSDMQKLLEVASLRDAALICFLADTRFVFRSSAVVLPEGIRAQAPDSN